MKTGIVFACGLFAGVLSTQAQAITGGHYPAGVEGIKGASLPPTGLYLRDYSVFYSSHTYADGPSDFSVFAFVNAPRLVWMTELEILGARYGMDVLMTYAYMDWSVGSMKDDFAGIGDMQIEPLLLAWEFDRFDLATGYALWIPTGDFDLTRPDLISKGFWSHMLTLGGTWYPGTGEDKSWAVSMLNRYEFCHEQQKTDIDPGQVYTAEWGVSKSLSPGLDVGLIGYYQQQVTEDRGRTASDKLDRKLGVGPEISAFWPKIGLFTSIRYAYEFGAVERAEGHLVAITLTKVL
jgi:hypothetical protein